MFLKLWFIQPYISKHYFFITAIFMVLKSNNTYSICFWIHENWFYKFYDSIQQYSAIWIFQDNQMLQRMVSKNMPPKNCVVDFGLQRLSLVNLGVIIISGRLRSAVQSFLSKLYFCGHKTPFRTHKSNLPNAGASERLAAVLHGERWSGKPNYQCIQVWRIRKPSISK